MNYAFPPTICALLVAAVLLATMTACDTSGEPRQLPTPEFDARQAFPDLTGDTPRQPDDQGGFEDRIAQAVDGDDGATDAPTRSVQTVPLGASLVSEVPADHDAWQWSRQSGLTLISYTPTGDIPQVIIVAQEDDTARTPAGPSHNFRTFLGDVDPGLGDGFDASALMQQAADGTLSLQGLDDGSGQASMDDILDAFAGNDTLTGGRGIGYQSNAGTFSGWRWLGKTPQEVTIRLAATEGTWSAQPRHPQSLPPSSIDSILDEAAEAQTTGTNPLDDLDIDGALNELRGVSTGQSDTTNPAQPAPAGQAEDRRLPDSPLMDHPPRRARMLVGQAQTQPNTGIHLAILCAPGPNCPHSATLADFLDRIHTGEPPPSGRQTDFDDHAQSLGLHFH